MKKTLTEMLTAKKAIKKVILLNMLLTIILCNSIISFASETTYEYIINYKNTTDGSLTRDRVITSVKDCAFINVSRRIYEVYCYVDGEVLQLNTSNYLVQVVSERYDAKNDEWVEYASGAPYIKMTSALECVGGISMYNNSEEFKKAIEEQSAIPPSSEEPPLEEPTEPEEPPIEEPTEPEEPSSGDIENKEYIIHFFETEFVYYVSLGFMFAFAITFLLVLVCYAFRNLLEIVKKQ